MMRPAIRGMPDVVELCDRDRDGVACCGLMWRPIPGLVCCWKCGNDQPGVQYRRIGPAPPSSRLQRLLGRLHRPALR